MVHGQAGLHSAAVQPVHGQAGGEGDEAGRSRVQGGVRADGGWLSPASSSSSCYGASDVGDDVEYTTDSVINI
jgi:hypothetical protein